MLLCQAAFPLCQTEFILFGDERAEPIRCNAQRRVIAAEFNFVRIWKRIKAGASGSTFGFIGHGLEPRDFVMEPLGAGIKAIKTPPLRFHLPLAKTGHTAGTGSLTFALHVASSAFRGLHSCAGTFLSDCAPTRGIEGIGTLSL
jgi:hypothetical protein